jgi:2C-methyl-D-erythritol 2,4-cyclodiphosphate synthase
MTDTKDILYLAMARGIFMGMADMGDMDALFPEINGDWHGASNNPEKVQKLANILRDNHAQK